MTKKTALMVATLVAPAVPALLLVGLSLMADTDILRSGILEVLLFVSVFFAIFYMYAVLFMLIFGLPVFLILRRIGVINVWTAFGAGALGGVLVALITRPNARHIDDLLPFVPIAMTCSFVFWLIWKRGKEAST